MSLSSDQARKAAENPPNQKKVKEGEKYQSRLRIQTEAYSREAIRSQSAWIELDNYLSNTLTSDKYNAITEYWQFPLPIVNISNDIVTDLYTVFNGRNADFSTQYPNERFKEIAEQTFSNLGIREWIERKGKKVIKSAPNSVTVVDLDEEGNPLLLLIPNERIKGYEFTKEGAFDYIVFLHSKGKLDNGNEWKKWAVYDDNFYRVVLEVKGSFSLSEENEHGLGYCPAKFFYDKPRVSKHDFDRSIPFTNTMGVMSKWTVFELFIYYAEHYNTFPAMEFADNGCDVSGCEGGIIYHDAVLNDQNDIITHKWQEECPTCAKKGLIGPGTAVGIEVSQDADVQDTRGVLKFVTPDTKSLEYIRKVQEGREDFIKQNTVGYNNVTTKEAVNEAQIRFLAESRSKTPREISMLLSELHIWMVETVALLLYDTQVTAFANYGTEFLVLTEKDILMLIQEAKKSGVQASEIAELNHMLIQTKYKTQPDKMRRLMITADLQPSAFDTIEELEKKFSAGMITREDYYISLNFNDLIRRFEMENGNIVTWGNELNYDKKIQRIYDTLIFYTNQKLESNEQNSSEQSIISATGTSDN